MVIKIWKILIDASGAMKDKKYGLKRFMRYGYDHNPLTDESRIKVESMHADVLLFRWLKMTDGLRMKHGRLESLIDSRN